MITSRCVPSRACRCSWKCCRSHLSGHHMALRLGVQVTWQDERLCLSFCSIFVVIVIAMKFYYSETTWTRSFPSWSWSSSLSAPGRFSGNPDCILYLFICVFMYFCICLFVNLFFVSLRVCVFVYLCVYLFAHLSIGVSTIEILLLAASLWSWKFLCKILGGFG